MAVALILGGETDSRYAIAQVLASAGHSVCEAADREAAQRWLGDADLAVVDLAGPELLEDVRRARPGMPLVCLAARGLAGSGAKIGRARLLECAVVLTKPFELDALLDAVALVRAQGSARKAS